ncbi:MAG TPA: hypothetical protein VMV49_08910 [Candidatus Deferrimicrobium sp.]|nr:hypothetical protein [Candidatus Deferrimicrobium sp.]
MNHSLLKIGFDITQKERGRIYSSYQGAKQIIEADGITCHELDAFPITMKCLQEFQTIIFACPDSSKLHEDEIETLLKYLSLGGNIFVLNHAGGDRGRRTNLAALTTPCGISFNNDQVLDSDTNLDVDAFPLITHFSKHPIFQGVENICYRIGCSLNITDNATALAVTENSATPPNSVVIALAACGKGHLIASGSYEMFLDDAKGGILYPNNAKLLGNTIKWLNLKHGSISSEPSLKPPEKSKSQSPISSSLPNENFKQSVSQIPTKNLEKTFKQLNKEMKFLKEEHQTILSENMQLQEKLHIFELNLASFPDHTISELNLEVEGINSKLKMQSQLISQLKSDLTLLKNDMLKIETNLENLYTKVHSNNQSNNDIPSEIPIITTAATLLNQKTENHNPKLTDELNACHQLLVLLDANFKSGFLTPAEYQKKRVKFEKKIAELEQFQ